MKLFSYFLISIVLAACVSHKPNDTPAVTISPQNGVKLLPAQTENYDDILFFCNNFSSLSAEAQKKIWLETQQSLQQNKQHQVARVKQAAMLALPDSKLRDLNKAQSQLQELLQENALNPRYNALVGLLYEYTAEQQRLSTKARDEAKKSEVAQQKLETLQSKHDALVQKTEQLQQKLNELRNLEKSLLQREKAVESKP